METKGRYTIEALEYIAKIADGGMRDAITLMDKCLAYSTELTLENVVKALGTVDYAIMIDLTDAIIGQRSQELIKIIENIHAQGKDLKQFIKQYTHFLLDVQKYVVGCDWKYINLPRLKEYEDWLQECKQEEFDICYNLLERCLKLNNEIKYSSVPKLDIETALLLEVVGGNK